MLINIEKIEHRIYCGGKLISTHKSFYLAQLAVERKLKSGKINNDYYIESIVVKEVIK